MNYGCSECLCMAIESHRLSLLRMLLERPGIEYRDLFWAPCSVVLGSMLKLINPRKYTAEAFRLQYHKIDESTNLSFVGHENCGHQQEDVEICNSLGQWHHKYILVSLPIVARWHSDNNFPAEQLLRQSRKFDFTEPQVYHFIDNVHAEVLCFTYEKSNSLSNNLLSIPTLGCFSDNVTVSGYLEFAHFRMEQSNRKLMDSMQLQSIFSPDNILEAIKFGFDINCYLHAVVEINYFNCRYFQFYGLFYHLWSYAMKERKHMTNEEFLKHLQNILSILFSNGLSFFIGMRSDESTKDLQADSFLDVLFRIIPDEPEILNDHYIEAVQRCRGIALQLLSLGYGRRELHSGNVPLFDEHLDSTRYAIRCISIYPQFSTNNDVFVENELTTLLYAFDAGPLSLLQLTRIAIRRSVGGPFFDRRLNSISSLVPPSLYKYVANPTELMHHL